MSHFAHSRIPHHWLTEWLDDGRESAAQLEVNRHCEIASSASFHGQLAEMIYRAKCTEDRLSRLASRVGWASGAARLSPPKQIQGRLGDFGEVLSVGLLETYTPGWVPIVKLRTQPDRDNSLHGTDIVLFCFDEDDPESLTQLEFVEVKTATSTLSNARAAVLKAHDQLAKDRSLNFLDTLEFIAERLGDDRPELMEPFLNYLASRADGPGGANRIVVLADADLDWPKTLDRLPDEQERVMPLEVHVVTVAKLADLVEAVWPLVQTRPLLAASGGQK